jgi:hypothetical protein
MTKINKIARAVALLIMIVAMMGCGIGYNKTLFLTKSNVGLDASVAPKPTFDLALSRFEGVISPGFEKGKKLPVLSSFRFKNEDTLALEVGSTYATGDAAIALAALYDDTTPGVDGEARLKIVDSYIYDSNLVLDNEPKIRKGLLETWFPSIFPPQEFQTDFVEPVIFGTDTSLGLKIAWSTAPAPPAPFPDSVKFGYNRTEIGLAPVTMEKKNNKVNMKMASLLATVDTGVTIGAEDKEVNLDHLQYFATGKAATLLTLQQDVRKAMLARLDPHAKYYAGKFAESVKGRGRTALVSILNEIRISLKNTEVPRAKQLADRMDFVESLVPETYGFTQYRWDMPKEKGLITTASTTEITKKGVQKAVVYWSALRDSRNALKESLESETVMVDGKEVGRAGLANEHEKIEQMYEEFDQRLLSHPYIIAAIKYLPELLK